MNNELKILELQKKQKEISLNHYSKRLEKYLAANGRVYNAVSQDDVDDLNYQIENLKLEIEILETKIKDAQDAS